MFGSSRKTTRANRMAAIAVSAGRQRPGRRVLHRREVGFLAASCLVVCGLLWTVTAGWAPPFPFRSGYLPARDLVSRATFQVKNEQQAKEQYLPGDVLARAGRPLSSSQIELLNAEHLAVLAQRGLWQRVQYALANVGMYLGLLVLCLCYLYFHQRTVLEHWPRLGLLLASLVATVALAVLAAGDAWRAESIPLIVFGMTLAIVYERQLALLLSFVVSLMIAVCLGQSLAEFIILNSAVAGPILMVHRIRSRTRLIYVGLAGGLIVFVTTMGVGILAGQAFGMPHSTSLTTVNDPAAFSQSAFLGRLASGAGLLGLYVVLAGFLMTGLLPFIERLFDVQTDISLLELGDAAHPLLQQLAQRAPGTYNHSINVASLAEPAAEAIGANGLLTRVGAYFHDIGKLVKPDYFVENQCDNGNQHALLQPAMSTLVIMAHVKDAVDLARKHRLPKSIIDFIEQHHGTTLVEYFYRQAEKRSQETPDRGPIDEASFRYPGPKPQKKETAVLMLADASEGACRTLVEPTPSRIESLVHDLAQKRMLDGQFDECHLTLKELHLIEESLVKSLSAVYHGRIKYPDQQIA